MNAKPYSRRSQVGRKPTDNEQVTLFILVALVTTNKADLSPCRLLPCELSIVAILERFLVPASCYDARFNFASAGISHLPNIHLSPSKRRATPFTSNLPSRIRCTPERGALTPDVEDPAGDGHHDWPQYDAGGAEQAHPTHNGNENNERVHP